MSSPDNKRHAQEIRYGEGVLSYLAQQTGGGFFEARDEHSLPTIFALIDDELRNQYSLGFSPSAKEATPGFHPVILTVTIPTFAVQTRNGYFVGD